MINFVSLDSKLYTSLNIISGLCFAEAAVMSSFVLGAKPSGQSPLPGAAVRASVIAGDKDRADEPSALEGD